MQEVEGSTPTGGTCSNDFSDPVDQDIRTQWALSWKIVVSEWRSVVAVSLNVGGGVRLIKPAKLYTNTQNTTYTTRTDARRRVCAAMVSYRWATRGTSLRELEYTHTRLIRFDSHRGHMSERFFRPNRPGYPHPVSIELENSGIRVAVGDCSVRLIKPAKLCMCTQTTTNTTRTDARRQVCAAMVPYRWATRETSLRELEYRHTFDKVL